MKIEITKAIATVHPFGMDTAHLYTQFTDPCDPNDLLCVSFKCPRGKALETLQTMFKLSSIPVTIHDFTGK